MTNTTVKQYAFLTAIIVIAVVLGWKLAAYFPGMLGAITLYILMRPYYYRITVVKNWKKWVAAIVFILVAVIMFVVPIWLLLDLLIPKLTSFFSNPHKLTNSVHVVTQHVQQYFPQAATDSTQVKTVTQKVTSAIPTVMGATLNMLVNTILTFFLLYFMLVDGRKMERSIQRFLPLKGENIDNIWEATRVMVVSNAIGLPALAACEAVTAMIGYYFFGIEDPILWGVVTGAFSLFPIVGTAIIWIPMGMLLVAKGETGHAIGLLLYAVIMINVDHLLRFTLLKKIGNVHPVITALGIIVGVPMFGLMGFIFGPLLISYLLLLISIYRVEFSPDRQHSG